MSDHQEYQLELLCEQQPATLERLLRVVRFRGFRVNRMEVISDNTTTKVAMTVSSQRPLHLLTGQLLKNAEVVEVQLE